MSVNIKVTGGLHIEWGQIVPKVTGGLKLFLSTEHSFYPRLIQSLTQAQTTYYCCVLGGGI